MIKQDITSLGKGVLERFALIFLPVAVAVTLIIWPVLHSYEQGRISIIKARESGYLDVSTRMIRDEFRNSMSDLRTLSRDPLLQRYLDAGIDKYRKEIEHLLQIHAEGYRRYDQIRLLDTKGYEVIRINYRQNRSAVVPQEALQDKSSRYYFSEAINLDQGEIYVSPIDLNVEKGQVEIPYKPTIRLATPVFDSHGKRLGVMVLNYRGDILLRAFHNDMRKDPLHQAMLLNRDGYWISSPNQEQEWGFMLQRDDLRFSTDFPAAWQQIKADDSGELVTDKGLLLFTTVYPLRAEPLVNGGGLANGGASNEKLRNYHWKVVILIPRDSLYATSFIRQSPGIALLLIIYLLLALVAYLTALYTLHSKQRRAQEKSDAAEIEDLYNLAPCGYHSLDRNGLIVRMNQTELSWLGYNAEELIGKKRYVDLLTTNSQEEFRDRFPQFLQQGYIHNVEFEVIRKDGSLLPIMISATAVRDDANNIIMSRTTVFDMTERKKLELRLKQQATTDFLTGLNNRRNFYYLAEIELVRSQRSGKPVSVLLIDIDHFKQINDTYGHEAGDKALQTFSSICREELREIDILGRIGGEEFAALLPETEGKTAIDVAYRLCMAVATSPITISPEIEVDMTISIGITKHMKTDRNIHEMFKRADNALYTAKKGGRNQVCYEDPSAENDTCTPL